MFFQFFFRAANSKVLFNSVFLSLLFIVGCQNSNTQSNSNDKLNTVSVSTNAQISIVPEANVFIDEVRLAKPYAIIGGSVQNVSSIKLQKLSIEIELRRRDQEGLVRKEIFIEPSDLAPGERGKFSLRVFSNEWSGSRVLSLRSATRKEEVAFKALPGSKRPPEKLQEGKASFDKMLRKRPRSNAEEFLNTPDTPVKVP